MGGRRAADRCIGHHLRDRDANGAAARSDAGVDVVDAAGLLDLDRDRLHVLLRQAAFEQLIARQLDSHAVVPPERIERLHDRGGLDGDGTSL